VLLLLLTVLNAVIGLRQKGKAESAMNALRSMMKATARVRRGGARSAADGHAVDPLGGRCRPRRSQRDRQGAAVGRDPRVHLGDQLRQDRHADDEPDDGGRGRRRGRPLHRLRHRLLARGQGPPRRGQLRVDRGGDPALHRRERRPPRRRPGRRRSRGLGIYRPSGAPLDLLPWVAKEGIRPLPSDESDGQHDEQRPSSPVARTVEPAWEDKEAESPRMCRRRACGR